MLELCLKAQFGERIYLLGHMYVVGVGYIALVGHARYHAKAPLQAFGELVGGGLQRRAIERIVDVLGVFPLLAFVVHALHYAQRERCGDGIGVAAAGHVLDALVQARIAQRYCGIAVVQQPVNRLALFQAGARAVLPQYRRGVGQRALEPVMAVLQRAVAQFKAFVEYLPELIHVAARRQRHVRQVDRDHALIEAAIVLVLARHIVARVGDIAHARVGEAVGGQERAATHAGVHVALELHHLLGRYVVGHHAARGALGRKFGQIVIGRIRVYVVLLQRVYELWEGGRYPHALFVLHALIALQQRLLDYHR